MRFQLTLASACAAAAAALASPTAAADQGCLAFPPLDHALPAPHTEAIAGRAVIRYLPPHPKGVIYLFHGTGGSEKFATRVQTQRALAPLLAAGYGYVSSASLDRTNPVRWKVDDASPTANADIAYMLALHATLIAHGEITAGTPVFTMGMSNGGAFANLFATAAKRAGLPVTAVADYMGPFPASMRPVLDDPKSLPPTLVILAQHDGLVSPDRVSAVAAQLAAGGAQVETHVSEERAVCEATFAGLPELSNEARRKLVSQTLPAAGVIDAQGRRLLFNDAQAITPDKMAMLVQKLDGEGREVANTLLIAWAAHQMRSDYADRQLAFFEAARTHAAPPPANGRR